MNATKDDRIEKLIKKFMKEAFKEKMENFSQKKNNQGSGFEEMFDMFKDFAEMITGEDSNTIDIEEEEVIKKESTDHQKGSKLEIKLLKEQITILKQQLKDKDDIINLLKEKAQ